MNKAITDGIEFQPPGFEFGLGVWSAGDGVPGSDTYANAANAAFVPADQDFGPALEIQKIATTTKLRYMGETPIIPGCYLRVTARLKCLSGNFPSVRIAGWPGRAGGTEVTGLPTTGPSQTFTGYGDILEVSAIISSASRNGVDLAWGTEPIYGHFGLDLTGPNGAIVRVDNITIEDVTEAFRGELLGRVDVRDYGAIGDGVADDRDAFNAADNDADGREVFVPEGTYLIGSNLTIDNPIHFVGTLTMPVAAQLTLRRNFNLPDYVDAMGSEVEGFKKAFQALMDFSDVDSLDMRGMKVDLTEPLDMAAAVPAINGFSVRRVIRNGQFQASTSIDWEDTVVNATGTYDPSDPRSLTSVTNIGQIEVGSHVSGVGVGREIYVRAKNEATNTITLSQPFFGGAGSYALTFRRFKYLLDFSGFDGLSKFNFSDVEFQCQGNCSGIMLAPEGDTFHVRDCFISQIKDRGVTSIGNGCQDLLIDRCQFTNVQQDLPVDQRSTIVFNTNANDLKLRNNRAAKFRHFGLIGGEASIVSGNHFFMGDGETDGVRTGGLIYAQTNAVAFITGNYIDNCWIEWTNEWEPDPDFGSQFSFSAMTITGNVFFATDVSYDFNFIRIKPYGSGHFIQGLAVQGNVFQPINGNIARVEDIDTTYATMDYSSFRNINFIGNTFNSIDTLTFNPVSVTHEQASDSTVWTVDFEGKLPFGGRARFVESAVPVGEIRTGATRVTDMFYVEPGQGPELNQVNVRWPQACRGDISITARVDQPR